MATDKKTPAKGAKPKAKPEDKGATRSEAAKKAKPASAPKAAAKSSKAPTKKAASAKPAAAAKPKSKPKKGKKSAPAPKRLGKSYYAKAGENPTNWHIVDAKDVVLGRLSSVVAHTLMGKHKPQFTRGADTGDFVVVINAEHVKLTGKKVTDKWYHYHTHFPGGIKSFRPKDLFEKHPERVIERAVFGMLPKSHLGRRWFKRLRVYAGESHPHSAQKPKPMTAVQDRK